jgi:hypothetical protein
MTARAGAATIDGVEPDPRDPNFRRVMVAGSAVARLSRADAEALGIAPGRPWTAAVRRKLAAIAAEASARGAALRMLGRRRIGSAEMVRARMEDGPGRAAARRAVSDLVENGWIEAGDRTVAPRSLNRAR